MGNIEIAVANRRLLSGPDRRLRPEAPMPGSVARIGRDAATFFLRDISALLGWQYGPDDAARVSAPVLYVGGTDSGSWFRQTRAWVQYSPTPLTSRQRSRTSSRLVRPSDLRRW